MDKKLPRINNSGPGKVNGLRQPFPLIIVCLLFLLCLPAGCDVALRLNSRMRHSQDTELTFGQWVKVERGFCRGQIGKVTDICDGPLYQVRLYRETKSFSGFEPMADVDGSIWCTWVKFEDLSEIDSPDPFE